MKQKVQDLIAAYERQKLWGSIELTFRSGEIVVIQKNETIKEASPNERARY